MKKKTTTLDIANILEMSRTTVSKALNNHPNIPEATRRIVMEAAAAAGYRQHRSKADRENKGPAEGIWVQTEIRTMAFLIQSSMDVFHSGFWNHVLRGVEEASRQNGCHLVFNFITPEDLDNLTLPQTLVNPQIGGLILAGLNSREYFGAVSRMNIPFVAVDSYSDQRANDMNCDIIMMENEQSVCDITDHLISLGHREIGFIGDISSCRSFTERWFGFTRAMGQAGLSVQADFCLTAPSPTHYYQYEEMAGAMGSMSSLPTAFVCANDLVALQLIKFLDISGLSVPQDISVAGFDLRTGYIDQFTMQPALTTAEVIASRIGSRAFDQLMWRLAHPESPFENVRIVSKVIYGQTTGTPSVTG